ncbi:hypothetical protein L1887_39200 [Cichorium endivia]|nr:hypothetical protein L1887_39200 [Cichorium endivia]
MGRLQITPNTMGYESSLQGPLISPHINWKQPGLIFYLPPLSLSSVFPQAFVDNPQSGKPSENLLRAKTLVQR